jgi:hypothetical protein
MSNEKIAQKKIILNSNWFISLALLLQRVEERDAQNSYRALLGKHELLMKIGVRGIRACAVTRWHRVPLHVVFVYCVVSFTARRSASEHLSPTVACFRHTRRDINVRPALSVNQQQARTQPTPNSHIKQPVCK